jgi:rare lipoprotein A (peptidoglycan hydrolase)
MDAPALPPSHEEVPALISLAAQPLPATLSVSEPSPLSLSPASLSADFLIETPAITQAAVQMDTQAAVPAITVPALEAISLTAELPAPQPLLPGQSSIALASGQPIQPATAIKAADITTRWMDNAPLQRSFSYFRQALRSAKKAGQNRDRNAPSHSANPKRPRRLRLKSAPRLNGGIKNNLNQSSTRRNSAALSLPPSLSFSLAWPNALSWRKDVTEADVEVSLVSATEMSAAARPSQAATPQAATPTQNTFPQNAPTESSPTEGTPTESSSTEGNQWTADYQAQCIPEASQSFTPKPTEQDAIAQQANIQQANIQQTGAQQTGAQQTGAQQNTASQPPIYQLSLAGKPLGYVADEQKATLLATQLKRLIRRSALKADAIVPQTVPSSQQTNPGSAPLAEQTDSTVKVATHRQSLFAIDESMAEAIGYTKEWAAVAWANNLRVALNEAPLDVGSAHQALKNLEDSAIAIEGDASWYGPYFHGRMTANGETYNQHDLTAAHKSLPFGTYLRVRNRLNNKTVVVRINDRGPYVGDRSLDLSNAAAKCLGSDQVGVIPYDAVILQRAEPVAP